MSKVSFSFIDIICNFFPVEFPKFFININLSYLFLQKKQKEQEGGKMTCGGLEIILGTWGL